MRKLSLIFMPKNSFIFITFYIKTEFLDKNVVLEQCVMIIFTEFTRFSKMECQEQSLLFFHGQKIELFQALFPRQLFIRMQIEENY